MKCMKWEGNGRDNVSTLSHCHIGVVRTGFGLLKDLLLTEN